MKNKLRITIASIAMMLLLAIPSVAQPPQARAAGRPAAVDQPKMREALAHLNQAKKALEQAMHDKGGHRAKAIGHIDQAINEVQAGIASGEQHEKKH